MSNPVHNSNEEISSVIQHFRKLDPKDRLLALQKATNLNLAEINDLEGKDVLSVGVANGMIENVIGKFELPLGVALNFKINAKDYLIPMAVEEPSVVAAASYMAKIARSCDGFQASSTQPIMRAQVQILNIKNPHGIKAKLLAARSELIELANSKDKVLVALGGGCKDIEIDIFDNSPVGSMVVLHLLVDVRDAMGANAVNTMAEFIAPRIEKITGGNVRLRILSNLADRRLVHGHVRVSPEALSTDDLDGKDVARGIVEACALAIIDPYRAATHNKGIMNGIDPVVVATGNDWRAIEAGAHAYAARNGRYTSLTRWEIDNEGWLNGSIELPMAVGLVGGATKTHPASRAAIKMLDVSSAQELAEVITVVGLAQNMAALRALATEGIQKGHMALHARNIAIVAGAKAAQIDAIASGMVASGSVSVDSAKELISRAEKEA